MNAADLIHPPAGFLGGFAAFMILLACFLFGGDALEGTRGSPFKRIAAVLFSIWLFGGALVGIGLQLWKYPITFTIYVSVPVVLTLWFIWKTKKSH